MNGCQGAGLGIYSVKTTVDEYAGKVDFGPLTSSVNKHIFIHFDLRDVKNAVKVNKPKKKSLQKPNEFGTMG